MKNPCRLVELEMFLLKMPLIQKVFPVIHLKMSFQSLFLCRLIEIEMFLLWNPLFQMILLLNHQQLIHYKNSDLLLNHLNSILLKKNLCRMVELGLMRVYSKIGKLELKLL